MSFSLKSGELLHITGKNGAGKSSLLKILAGLMEPESGSVHFDGQPIYDLANEYYRQLCYLGHKTGVNLLLTAEENLNYWRKQHHTHAEPSSAAILQDIGLIGLEDISAGQLSAGQQRRVALARLWVTKAKLWILDEPFTALDVELIARLEQKLAEHVKAGGAAIITSHQPVNITNVTTSIVQIDYRF